MPILYKILVDSQPTKLTCGQLYRILQFTSKLHLLHYLKGMYHKSVKQMKWHPATT